MILLQIKERAKIFGQYDRVAYGQDYFDKLRSIGFTVVEEDYTKNCSRISEKYCLAKGDYSVCFK
jgi:hypothetical protein